MKILKRFLAAAAAAVLITCPAWAETTETAAPAPESKETAVELAKKLSNPLADLVSIPFQANWNMGVGPYNGTQFLLNFQPVVPVHLSPKWNLIERVIIPVLSQPPLVLDGPTEFGLGDILISSFFSPAQGKLVWGVGPVLSLPVSSSPYLGSQKWSIGPTFVILKQSGPWTYGVLWNQIWSVAGTSDIEAPDVSQMYTQPFLAYTTKKAVTYAINSETITNWKASSGDQWTIPINLMISKLSKFGPFPASYQVGIGGYVDSPEGGPSWKLRAVFTLLLPQK